MMEIYYPDGETSIPVLTITGDGLTFSGENKQEVEVYIIITDTVNSVSFNDLKLSGSYDKGDALLFVKSEDPLTDPLTISIEGECYFERTGNAHSTLRIERPVNFAGTGEDATLEIHASWRNAIFSDLSNIVFNNLNLIIDVKVPEGDEWGFASAFDMAAGNSVSQVECSFVNSKVSIESDNMGFNGTSLAVKIKNSTFVMNCKKQAGGGPDEIYDAYIIGFTVDNSNVGITAGQGLWINGEAAFTGDSQIKLTATEDDSVAFCATEGITVDEGYDLGGA